MEKRTNEELFRKTSDSYDHKHINNTSDKPMPSELIDKINDGNVTLEVLDDFKKRGYDIYKYQTQLTIHGTFDSELQRRVHGYVCMVVNKNGSLGVRWRAIDAKKKAKIFHYLKGWCIVDNSQDYYAYKLKQIHSKDDPTIAEYKAEAARINQNLFIGSVWVDYFSDMWGFVYVQLCLNINAIPEANVIPLVEDITQTPIAELDEQIRKEKEEARLRLKKWEEEQDRKQKESAERRAPFIAKAKEDAERLKQELLANGYEYGKFDNLKRGDEITAVGVIQDGVKDEEIRAGKCVYKVTFARGGNVNVQSESGCKRKLKPNAEFFVVKKEKPQKKENKPISGTFQIVDYSEKAIAVTGDTRDIKAKLKKMGGRYNPRLTCGAGWIFPKKKENELRKLLNL